VSVPLSVLSAGLGTQSCALALMSAVGQLPKLDHIVFADTQGERPETYAYLAWLAPVLADAGMTVTTVSAGSLEAALLTTVPTSSNPTPPAHVRNPDGSKGRIGQYRCSYDFKRRLVDRAVKHACGGRGAWKRANVEQWIGFSADEMGRCKQADECRCGHRSATHDEDMACSKCKCDRFDRWQTNRWPLIELQMRRSDTIAWFGEHGFPTPPRSACWFCPNSGNDRWQSLQADHPDLFERACVLDETIRGGGFNARGNQPFAGQLFLHGSLAALRDADLRTKAQVVRDSGQGELWDEEELGMDCQSGVCFT
jgi:hypothetical protein